MDSDLNPRFELTVGVPTYNSASTLRATLESLVSQTLQDFHIVVSDNASTDETCEIVRDFAQLDSRISLSCQPKNIGAGRNFLWLAEHAQTPFFAWCASDDTVSRRWFEVLLTRAIAQGGAAFGRVQQVDLAGGLLTLPANERDFSFRGPRLIRQFNFLRESGLEGRANLIYSVMPRKVALNAAMSLTKGDHGDQVAVFGLLRSEEISSIADAVLCKRIPVNPGRPASDGARIPHWRVVHTAWTATLFPQILRSATIQERLLAFVALPASFLRGWRLLRRDRMVRQVVFGDDCQSSA